MKRNDNLIATPPGATIREQLEMRGMNQKELAIRMGYTEKHISKLINGEVILTPEMAVRLETVLDVPASFWLNLEAIYREKLIKIEDEQNIEQDFLLLNLVPYTEMAHLEWVPVEKDAVKQVQILRKYFEVVSLPLLDKVTAYNIACRRLNINEQSDMIVYSWIHKAELVAKDTDVSKRNIAGLTKEIPNILELTKDTPEEYLPKLQSLLAKYGIALVVLPYLKGSYLHGISMISGNKIVLGLTDRYKSPAKFRKGLFHELGHIMLEHINNVGGITEEQEKEADIWAEEILNQ